jgi:exopolyphosphatase/guanosine-5'-triphosphate,3'-diphosphate pyrophosphatase
MKKLKASIDIGSNSILLLIAYVSEKKVEIVERYSTITSLGLNLDKTGIFDHDSLNASFEALKQYAIILNKNMISTADVIVTATEASRVAKNATEFFHRIAIELGFVVSIITPQAEAHYSAKGACLDLVTNENLITIMDIGGASSELIRYNVKEQQIDDFVSLPTGSVRWSDWLKEEKLEESLLNLEQKYLNHLVQFKTDHLLCVAGTLTSVANMLLGNKDFIEQEVHNSQFTVSEIERLYEQIKRSNPDKLLECYPFLGKRSKAIVGGISVALYVFNRLQVKTVTVSTYGLMFGTIQENEIPSNFLA